jgi:hypothetical protein
MRRVMLAGCWALVFVGASPAQDLYEQYQAAHDVFVGTYSVGSFLESNPRRLLEGIEGDWIEMGFSVEVDRGGFAERCETSPYRLTRTDETTFTLDLVNESHPTSTVLTALGGASFMAYTAPGSVAAGFGYEPTDTMRIFAVMPLFNGPSSIFRPSEDILVIHMGQRSAPRVLGRCDALPE